MKHAMYQLIRQENVLAWFVRTQSFRWKLKLEGVCLSSTRLVHNVHVWFRPHFAKHTFGSLYDRWAISFKVWLATKHTQFSVNAMRKRGPVFSEIWKIWPSFATTKWTEINKIMIWPSFMMSEPGCYARQHDALVKDAMDVPHLVKI